MAVELFEVMKIALIGIAACNVISTPRSGRTFVVWYLALFALYPVRGALYNYVHEITEAGRISWNFFFRNPNDLALACFLPLGLCAYVISWKKTNGYDVRRGLACRDHGCSNAYPVARGDIVPRCGLFVFCIAQQAQDPHIGGHWRIVCAHSCCDAKRRLESRSRTSNLSTGDMSLVDPEGSVPGAPRLCAWPGTSP